VYPQDAGELAAYAGHDMDQVKADVRRCVGRRSRQRGMSRDLSQFPLLAHVSRGAGVREWLARSFVFSFILLYINLFSAPMVSLLVKCIHACMRQGKVAVMYNDIYVLVKW